MRNKLLPLLLVIVTVASYGYLYLVGDPEFVYDDVRFVRENREIRSLANLPRFFSDPRTSDVDDWGGIYRPLRTLDFALDWAIAGPSPWWYHLRNAIYHAAGALLVLALLGRWGLPRAAAALGAFFFALHPAQVEAVGWITSRGDLLCLVFLLAALLVHQRGEGLRGSFFGALGLYTLALFSKEEAVVFPAAALLADFFFRDGRRLRRTFRRWPRYAIYLGVGALYALLWIGLHHAYGERDLWHLREPWGGSFLGSLLTMSRGLVYYGRIALFPVDLAQDWYLRPVSAPDPLTVLCAVLVAALVAFAVVRAFRGGGWVSFAVLWFLVTISPVSNVAGPIGIPTAERFLYLPLVGLAGVAGALLGRIWALSLPGRALAVLLLAALAVGSVFRSRIWETEETMWGDAIRRTGELSFGVRFESPRAYDWWANEVRLEGEELLRQRFGLLDRGREREAREADERGHALLEKSVELYDRELAIWGRLPGKGNTAIARAAKALSLFDLGRHEEALALADEVLRNWPSLGTGLYARSLALLGLGRLKEAKEAAEAALRQRDTERVRRGAAKIYEQLAQHYEYEERDRAMAFVCLQRSWQLLPSQKDNGGVYEAMSRMEEEFKERATKLKRRLATPKGEKDAGTWLELAKVFSAFGEWDEADKVWEMLLAQAAPRPIQVLLPYALYHWEWRDTEEGDVRAIGYYREILRRDPEQPQALEGLARVRGKLERRLARHREALRRRPGDVREKEGLARCREALRER